MTPREYISCKKKGDPQKGEIRDFCTIVVLGVVTRVTSRIALSALSIRNASIG